eukprot:10660266-Prorocentrum_lima.AAC.1
MWVVSPPCAGLQDVARDIRNTNQGRSEFTIDERHMNFYTQQVAEMAGRRQRAAQELVGAPGT